MEARTGINCLIPKYSASLVIFILYTALFHYMESDVVNIIAFVALIIIISTFVKHVKRYSFRDAFGFMFMNIFYAASLVAFLAAILSVWNTLFGKKGD